MEVQKEAQRIMTLLVWKMYHSRMQRGGFRLHRSLQLSLVMRSARELYLSAKVEAHQPEFPPPRRALDPRLHRPSREAEAAVEAASPDAEQPPEPMDKQEGALRVQETPALCNPPPARVSHKQWSSSNLSEGSDARLVPSKKACLEGGDGEATSEVPDRLQLPPAQSEGAFPNLAHVLQRRFSSLLNCGPAAVPPPTPPYVRGQASLPPGQQCAQCAGASHGGLLRNMGGATGAENAPRRRRPAGPVKKSLTRPELPTRQGENLGARGAGAFSQTCVHGCY